MTALFQRFVRDETATTAIEYALIASLISIMIIIGATAIGTTLDTVYQDTAAAFPG